MVVNRRTLDFIDPFNLFPYALRENNYLSFKILNFARVLLITSFHLTRFNLRRKLITRSKT